MGEPGETGPLTSLPITAITQLASQKRQSMSHPRRQLAKALIRRQGAPCNNAENAPLPQPLFVSTE